MLIIVEGPDGAGKTTFIDRLYDHIQETQPNSSVKRLRARPPKHHPLDEYVKPLLDYVPNSCNHIICDRWHWGERVYPTILNRHSVYTQAMHTYVEMFLLSRGAFVVYMTAPYDVLSRRIEQRGDDLVNRHHIPYLILSYDAVAFDTVLPMRRINTEFKYNPHHCSHIVNLATQCSISTKQISDTPSFIGAPDPRYLIVSKDGSELIPTAMPYPGTSGELFVNNFLHRVTPELCGIVVDNDFEPNSCHPDIPWYTNVVLLDSSIGDQFDLLQGCSVPVLPHFDTIWTKRPDVAPLYGEVLLHRLMIKRKACQ